MMIKSQPHGRPALALAFSLSLFLAGCAPKNDVASATPPSEPRAAAPDTTTNVASSDADNSRRNARDRTNDTLTSGDQGNSESDRSVTQKIRQSLVATDLSTMAKNVKIITLAGKVTLRGPVPSDSEKTTIASLAQAAAGEGNVANELEVKTNP